MSEEPRKPDAADVPVDPELARLYRDAAREEPPQHLDAAILAAARREAGAQPRPLEQAGAGTAASRMKTGNANRYRRWHVSVALAAALVLSVSVVTLHREEEERQPAAAPGAPPAVLERRDAPAPFIQVPASPSAQKAVPKRTEEQAGTPAVLPADATSERWGERIMALRRQGKAAEADDLVAEFRRRFPGRVVPEEWTR